MTIDDDYTLAEGQDMPATWHRLAQWVPLTVRHRTSRIPGLPLLAYGSEFSRGVLSVFGPRYLDLFHFTCWDAYRSTGAHDHREAFEALQRAHPDTFSTVIGCSGPGQIWLALRLTRLTAEIVDSIALVHDRSCISTVHLGDL